MAKTTTPGLGQTRRLGTAALHKAPMPTRRGAYFRHFSGGKIETRIRYHKQWRCAQWNLPQVLIARMPKRARPLYAAAESLVKFRAPGIGIRGRVIEEVLRWAD